MNAVANTVLSPEQAVEHYGPLVLRTAYGLVKNMQDAEDIAQEVFLSLVKNAPSFDGPDHQQAWLLRCTINRCKSHFRSVWQRRTDPLDEGLSVPFTPGESEVMKAVGGLPLKYRQVIYLHYIQGYTTGEIARLLQLNQNTVLSQLARGRALLKKTLKGEF